MSFQRYRFPWSPMGTLSSYINATIHANLQKTIPSRIVPCTGIVPMNSFIHVATFDQVMINVINFLRHHCLALYQFWMTPFLPELMRPIMFVGFL